MSDKDDLEIEINGKMYDIKHKEVFDLIHLISVERDQYRGYIEGKIAKADLQKGFPQLNIQV